MSAPKPKQNLESSYRAGLRQGLGVILESEESAAARVKLLGEGGGLVADWKNLRPRIWNGPIELFREWCSSLGRAPRNVDLSPMRKQLRLFLATARRLAARLRLEIRFWEIAGFFAQLARYVGAHSFVFLVFWLALVLLLLLARL